MSYKQKEGKMKSVSHRQSKLYYFLLMFVFIVKSLNAQLVNPNATKETKALKALLDSLYGKKIISGQCDDKYLQYIKDATGGKAPAIMGYDFNGICPSQGGNKDADKAIDWVINKGGIAQFQWHWISPNADGDYYSSNFKLSAALADTNSTSYKNMIRDIDLVAGAIKKMQDAGVPILWRPLHEAEGKWFWWGMSGGDACKKLWNLFYDRFTNYYKLNNIIWVWNSYGTTKENWYPGDNTVDIIAYDYPDYSASGSWSQYQRMFGNRGKLFGIGEDGKLTDPDILSSQHWLYFLTWAYMVQEPSQTNGKNLKDWLFKVYNDPRVFTLDDLQSGPKAYAGVSQTLYDNDGDGFENVTLDGSASKTDIGTITDYIWTENNIEIAHGVKPVVKLSIGSHRITLTIKTSTGQTKSAFVLITVRKKSLSLNKPVRVSSTEANLGNVPANAVDGSLSTRWSSAYSDPQWFEIDLGKTCEISQAVINWESASAKNYSIELSDDKLNWSSVAAKTNLPAGGRVDSINNISGKGRYIRMYGTQRTSTWGYSIWEFEVYGTEASTIVNRDKCLLPSEYSLKQNFPNPFNPGTTILFSLPQKGDTKIIIYDVTGKKISTLIDEEKLPGNYEINFDGTNLASGVYFCRFQSGAFSEVKKLILQK